MTHPEDTTLLAHVRPLGWTNPTPKPRYQLVVIGGGPAGLVAAAGAAGLGATVALVERDRLGGDCLNFGCVPSKTLLRAAKVVAEVRRARSLGIRTAEPEVDFPAVMQRVRQVRAQIAANDSATRFTGLGIDVFFGEAKFLDEHTLEVENEKLHFNRGIIATGARAKRPESPGLSEAKSFTNETIFTLTTLPTRLLVIGGGPIGCELGQAFARLGSRVTISTRNAKLLPREDAEASELLAQQFRSEGIAIVSEVPPLSEFDAVLLATGRQPNVDSLNLAAAHVVFDPTEGIRVDHKLRTTNPHILAVGDVCSLGERFTHAADAMARVAVQNALFPKHATLPVIPHATYTDPEIASIGAMADNGETQEFRFDLAHLDRAATEGTTGFLKVRTELGTDRIVGATVVGPNAGEIIGTVSLAMQNGLGLRTIAGTVFPYPTYTEAIKKIADQYSRTRLTPMNRWLLRTWLKWRR